MRRYYKINPNFEKHQELQRFMHSCQKAESAAETYAKRFGAYAFHTHPSALAGGVSYLEFENAPDERTWRKVTVLDGKDCYEPNVIQMEGVMVAKSKFRPSDTKRKVFSKLPRTWNQVRPLKTLQEWAKMIGYKMTDDLEQDAKFVHQQLKDTLFWHFIEFAGLGVSKSSGKMREPLYVKRAVTAAVELQKLPVVFPDSLYDLLGAKTDIEEDSNEESSTPQFFYWESRGDWYVALDYPIDSEDSEPIEPMRFIYAMNTALREADMDPVSCFDD